MCNNDSHFGEPLPEPVKPFTNPASDRTNTSNTDVPPVLHLKHDFLIRPDVYALILNSVDYVRKTNTPKVLVLLPRDTWANGCDDVYMQSMFNDLQQVFKGMGDDIAFTCAFASDYKEEHALLHVVVGIYDVNQMLRVPLDNLVDNQPSYHVPIHPLKMDELADKISLILEQNAQNFIGTVPCLVYDHSVKTGSISNDGIEAAEIKAHGLRQLGTTSFSPFVHVDLLLNKDVIAIDTSCLVK